jgi:hypothetical protein
MLNSKIFSISLATLTIVSLAPSAVASGYPQCFTGKAGDSLCVTITNGRIRTDRVDRYGRTKSGNNAPRPKPKRVLFKPKGAPTSTQGTGR